MATKPHGGWPHRGGSAYGDAVYDPRYRREWFAAGQTLSGLNEGMGAELVSAHPSMARLLTPSFLNAECK